MKKLIFLFPIILAVAACVTQKNTNSETKIDAVKGRRLEILFLGDNGHHRPIERIPQLMTAFGSKGINLTYSDNLNDLNPQNLSLYDGVLLYANWDSIPPAPEKALIDFVASGKGFIPVHCASYCFRNSAELVKMMGGQFWRHTWDTIRPVWTNPNHPAMMGVKQFKTLDETYLHTKLQADNLILTEREIQPDQYKDKPNQKTEPYTWVRNYGKGRVFYTAYGHDENTWSNPEFQKLLEKGIRWAVGDQPLAALEALNPLPFTYKEAKLPNYEKRSGPQLRQSAVTADESMKHIQIPPDFTLDLFAAEPNVQHPIAMSWDERGRLYVLVTKDYPNERKDTGGSDFILICEDTDKDGKADKFTKFADNLSIPTGMVFANGGLIVSQAPHVLFLKDTNGDDKADERKILFSGFGTGDTHAGPSNLHYGFDNWIWGCVGYSGFAGKLKENADSLKFGQAFFRFKPDGSKIEWMTSTSNNTWGMSFNESGDVFGSTANNAHGWYMAIPHRYFNGGENLRENGSRSTDTHKDMKPITDKVRQVDVFGGFTAASGHNFYTARAFPKKYWNKVAFVSEPTGHVLHQNVMEKKGSDYEDVEGFNLMAGADEWFSPVFSEVGPDGAVWVADWYSFIIQHNPTPKGFTNGTGNAYETDLRDYTHGRIYRVGWKQAPAYQPVALSIHHPDLLLANLKNSNLFWRMNAQRLLVERGKTDVFPELLALLNDQTVDEVGNNPAIVHALWTLKGLGYFNTKQKSELWSSTGLLAHPSAAVRKNVIQVLPATSETAKAILESYALYDKDLTVVINALLKLSEVPMTAEIEKAIFARLENATETNDRWLPDAFTCVMTANKAALMKKMISMQKPAESSAAAMANHDHSKMMSMNENKPTASLKNGIDLVVSNFKTEPVSPAIRENTNIIVEVTNNGTADLQVGTAVPLAIRVEGPSKLQNMVSMTFVKGVKSGETVMINQVTNGPWTGNMAFNSEKAGEFTISVTVDPDNLVKEADETNNKKSKKLTYQGPKNLSDFVMERSLRSYASVASPDSLVQILRKTSSETAIKALSEGWNYKRKATVEARDIDFLTSINEKLSGVSKERFSKLLAAWGVKVEQNIDPNLQVIRIKSVKDIMQFDKKEFTVIAGKPVELIFENPDAMQHNLVICKPKSMEKVGNASDKMITAKDGLEKSYIPALSEVLFSMPLVNIEQTYKLKFTAPAEVGDYPYICTFPGHWRLMNGTMKVVKDETAKTAK